jgi:hypothetical protein
VSALGLAGLAPDGASAQYPPHDLKIAFIGDQGDGTGAVAVLELITAEGAHAVLHSGDFDYGNNPAAWDARIGSILGADFPYFACVGNHDRSLYYAVNGYQHFIRDRMIRLGIPWNGDLGVASGFTWQGIHFVTTAPDIFGPGDGLHDLYIRDSFAASSAAWRISSWHRNQHLMQTGDKPDDTGWGVYEESRRAGAIIATGHEHAYSRTHLLSSMEQQAVASTGEPLVLAPDDVATGDDEGRSFAFVSGLGGKSIRNQKLSGTWFASVYTSTQGATHGALFGVFHVDGDPRLARFYFKDVAGNVADEFTVRSVVGCDDGDGDGFCDEADDCSEVPNPSQLDSDFDGYGNACDPDYTNNGSVGGADLQLLSEVVPTAFPDAGYAAVLDADGDGAIGDAEMQLLTRHFGGPPGPSGLACAGSIPCTACDAADGDGDGVCDALDDCVAAPDPLQVDSNLDGYGNACDPDYTNDGSVGTPDFLIFRETFGAQAGDPRYRPDVDSNSDGGVGARDLLLIGRGFGTAPGPSALACAGAPPCLGGR